MSKRKQGRLLFKYCKLCEGPKCYSQNYQVLKSCEIVKRRSTWKISMINGGVFRESLLATQFPVVVQKEIWSNNLRFELS